MHARTLPHSHAPTYTQVTSQIFSLPDSCMLWPGHDYSGRTVCVRTRTTCAHAHTMCGTDQVTSVAEEKEHNPRLTKSKEGFVALMQEKFDGTSYATRRRSSQPPRKPWLFFASASAARLGSDRRFGTMVISNSPDCLRSNSCVHTLSNDSMPPGDLCAYIY